jgi:hypothetical protein
MWWREWWRISISSKKLPVELIISMLIKSKKDKKIE